MKLFQKDPDSTEPFGFDWTTYLSEIGASETISTSTWSATPSGLTLSGGSIVTGSKKTQIKVAGGVAGTRYTVTNRIITSSSYTDDRSFIVIGAER